MIGRLEGRLFRVRPGEVVVDAGGVGYRVSISLRAFDTLAGATDCALWIHTSVRSDQIALYGFLEIAELELFERLIGIAGVGPRTALAALSTLAPDELAAAVQSGDASRLRKIPGIGKKTADRILLELAGVLKPAKAAPDNAREDAVSALVNLGYSERDARKAVDSVEAAPGTPLPEILRLALKALNR